MSHLVAILYFPILIFFFKFLFSNHRKGMAESTAVGKSGKKEDIEIKSKIEFIRTQDNSFRAEMCEISGVPYVAIVKFWQPENCNHFIPTRKGIFLTLPQWNALGGLAESINRAFATFASDGIDTLCICVLEILVLDF